MTKTRTKSKSRNTRQNSGMRRQIDARAAVSPDAVIGEGCVIHPFAVIASGVTLRKNVEVFPGAYVGKPPSAAGGLSRRLHYRPNVEIGEGSVVGPNAVIYYDVVIGARALIGDGASIREQCRIGDDCLISRCVTVNYNVQIGDRTRIMDNTHITGNMRIGSDCFISLCVGTTNDNAIGKLPYDPERVRGPIVEDGAAIGAGATILPALTIGRNSIVGAGSVVTGNVQANAIVTGSPARVTGYVEMTKAATKRYAFDASDAGQPSASSTSVAGVTVHQLRFVEDMRGNLSVGEFAREIPFVARRFFSIFDVPGSRVRGEHALKACDQFIICLKGRASVVIDDGTKREEVLLDRPNIGVYIPAMIWTTFYKFSPDAILLVFASTYYQHTEYIRDYQEYLGIVRKAQ